MLPAMEDRTVKSPDSNTIEALEDTSTSRPQPHVSTTSPTTVSPQTPIQSTPVTAGSATQPPNPQHNPYAASDAFLRQQKLHKIEAAGDRWLDAVNELRGQNRRFARLNQAGSPLSVRNKQYAEDLIADNHHYDLLYNQQDTEECSVYAKMGLNWNESHQLLWLLEDNGF
ncbi:MAG: hypothetical protein Q9176_000415 [Flavoplaca citrina]